MQKSYLKNYLKIYLWQGLSICLNLFSMFIVAPKLTSVPTIYGIYTISISVAIFLSYADFGFIGAGYKYASERFASGERDEEAKIIGFVSFVLFVFLVIFALVILIFSFNPSIIIKQLKNAQEIQISSRLLLILALFAPAYVLPRILQIIYGTRLEDYVFQRISILGSLIKISSIFYFFQGSKYDIVGYFLFSQIVNLSASLVSLSIARKRYNYNFLLLLKSFGFSKETFNKTKGLAFNSLFLTVSWVIYYELDSLFIGKTLGPDMVAIYAIGLTLTQFLRTIFGMLYTPFSARFNHFIGLKDDAGLKNLFVQVVEVFMPLVVFTVLSVTILMEPFVICWVGPNYINSVHIAQFLVLCYIFYFITSPAGIILVAYQKIKMLYLSNLLLPLIYWIGVYATFYAGGILYMAFFKLFAFSLYSIVLLLYTLKILNIGIIDYFRNIIMPLVVPVLFLIIVLIMANPLLPLQKSKYNLAVVIGTGGIASCISMVLYYLFSKRFRGYVNKVVSTVITRA